MKKLAIAISIALCSTGVYAAGDYTAPPTIHTDASSGVRYIKGANILC